MNASKKLPPIDPVTALEQRFSYRVHEYLADGRGIDAEFTLPGLRGWMLGQNWPEAGTSQKLEFLAVLCWTAICEADAHPERESAIRQELARQLDYLDGSSSRRPGTIDALLSPTGRTTIYANLRNAAEPGSSRRESFGLPRFNTADKLS